MKLQDISRELYLDNEWQMPLGLQNRAESDPLNYTQGEGQQAKRVKVDPQTLKAMFQKCWAVSDSRNAFANALQENELYLVKGSGAG